MMLNYFGTDLSMPGHYSWFLDYERMQGNRTAYEKLPFSPEQFPKIKDPYEAIKGEVHYYHESGCTILAIHGSCSDKRMGTKSVFYVEEIIPFEEIKSIVKSTPVAMRIINQFPFDCELKD